MPVIINGSTGISGTDGSAGTPAIQGTDTNTGIYFPGNDRIGFAEGGVQVGEFDASGNFQFNSGYGSVATAFGCRVWVNFNGTGTVAIRGSGNVSSISDNGTGDYTINFTTAMPDANYGVSFAWDPNLSVTANESRAYNFATPAAGSLRVYTYSSTAAVAAEDWQFISVSIFR